MTIEKERKATWEVPQKSGNGGVQEEADERHRKERKRGDTSVRGANFRGRRWIEKKSHLWSKGRRGGS